MNRHPDSAPSPADLDELVGALLSAPEDGDSLAGDYADAPAFGGGRYRLGDSLGAGAMGRVFRALDTATMTEVALKVIHQEHTGDETLRARFEGEAALLQKCAHPGVVRFIDSGVDADDGTPYFTMELMEGSLRDWLGRPLPLDRIVAWMKGVCDALRHAHGLGVVHGDLKASNLLLGEGGTVLKVADFTVAREVSDGTDEAEDIRALGEVFYAMLTGRAPRMHCPPPSVAAGRPRHCDFICQQAATTGSGGKFSSIADFAGALESLENPPSTWRRVVRWSCIALGVASVVTPATWYIFQRLAADTRTSAASFVSAAPAPSPARPYPGMDALAEMPAAGAPADAAMGRPFKLPGGQCLLPVPGLPGVLLAATEIRRCDFAEFTRSLSVEQKREILSWVSNLEKPDAKPVLRTWLDTCALPNDAAAGIPWTAANAYCQWLTARERAANRLPDGAVFRLPWASEWFRALMGDKIEELGNPWPEKPLFSWGTAWPPPAGMGNFPGVETTGDPRRPPEWPILNRTDPYRRVAPVASFHPNAHGFFDLDGNLSEWALDPPTVAEHARPARLVLGTTWMFTAAETEPMRPVYDYEDVAVEGRGFRIALQFAPSPAPLLQLTLHSVSDASGTPHSDHPGRPGNRFIVGSIVRVTWRADNFGTAPAECMVRGNACAEGTGWKTIYRGPADDGGPALGGGNHLPAMIHPGTHALFSFDMDTSKWPPGAIRISSAVHGRDPAKPCLETSSPGANLPWIPPEWWIDAFVLTESAK